MTLSLTKLLAALPDEHRGAMTEKLQAAWDRPESRALLRGKKGVEAAQRWIGFWIRQESQRR